jgi:hypothetical protein
VRPDGATEREEAVMRTPGWRATSPRPARRARRLGRHGAGLLALLAVWATHGPAAASSTQKIEELLWDLQIVPLEGAAPPSFTLRGLDPPPRSLEDARGRVVLLYFWAVW